MNTSMRAAWRAYTMGILSKHLFDSWGETHSGERIRLEVRLLGADVAMREFLVIAHLEAHPKALSFTFNIHNRTRTARIGYDQQKTVPLPADLEGKAILEAAIAQAVKVASTGGAREVHVAPAASFGVQTVTDDLNRICGVTFTGENMEVIRRFELYLDHKGREAFRH